MNFDIKNWGKFKISDLFPILESGKAIQSKLIEGNDCFYIGAKKDNNGVMFRCAYDPDLIQKGNCIIFICDGEGSVGYANYMNVDFIGTPNVVAGYNEHINEYNGLFIATVLCKERSKYSYGRKWKTHLKDTVIILPQTKDGSPDWDFMEEYIKSLNYNPITTQIKSNGHYKFNVNTWKEFKFGNLLSEIYKAKAHVKIDMNTYNDSFHNAIPFISRTDSNNGCDCYVENDNLTGIEKGNAIVVGDTTATCSYQGEDFICGDHIVICRAEWLNLYTGLFIVSLLKRERYKYSYGRSFKKPLIKDTILKLPVKNGCPDWYWIENFMKQLPYSDKLAGQ